MEWNRLRTELRTVLEGDPRLTQAGLAADLSSELERDPPFHRSKVTRLLAADSAEPPVATKAVLERLLGRYQSMGGYADRRLHHQVVTHELLMGDQQLEHIRALGDAMRSGTATDVQVLAWLQASEWLGFALTASGQKAVEVASANAERDSRSSD